MTLDKVSSRASMNSAHRREPNIRLSGRWLILARVGWIALVLFMLGVAIVSLPASFVTLHHPCPSSPIACSGLGLLSASDLQALPTVGFSRDAYAWFWIVTSGGSALVLFVVGGILFWRKSDDWIALLVALMCISVGATMITGDLQLSPSIWGVLQNSVLGIESLAILFTLALFPNGRFVPGFAFWITLVYPAYLVLYLVFLRQLRLPDWSLFSNPPNAIAWFGCWIVLTGAQLYRYFRVSTVMERQQTKWVAFSFFAVQVAGVGGNIGFSFLSLQNNGLFYLLADNGFSFIILIIPCSIVLAILRYRLWDIDVIINRTLVYGALTGTLALVYFGLIFGLQYVLRGIISQNNGVAIMVSTLAIAALFQPLRHRIQAIIDRRFYRRKYDAAKTLEMFSATLRNEVDLSQLREHLISVVQDTIQPSHVSLWLREPDRKPPHPDRM